VAYRGEAPAYNDLMGKQIQMMVGNFAAASALLGNGRLRALAVTGKERSSQLPEIPTVAESGLPGFENTGWFGLLAPAGTPASVINKVQADTVNTLSQTDTKARLFVQGMSPVGNTSADFAKAMVAESQRWATVVNNRKLAGTN
jgi:tripartite-type tricarboxylate transporter receptor subunit TctC